MDDSTHIQVSIILPCYNESAFIEGVLEDVDRQDFPKTQLELLVLDGGSTDGTREIVEAWSRSHPYVKLLTNPDRYVPQAMNKGIREARGQIIVRMDAHAGYPSHYVAALVRALKENEAENVGGVWITEARSEHPRAIAIARALTHPFGIGNAGFRTGVKEVMEVDTVPFGCYPRRVFQRFGLYDERLHRNQDIELNKRIKREGGSILLFPHIHCTYFARDTYSGLWKNNFATGRWVIRTAFFTGHLSALSLRHFIPFCFVTYLILLIIWVIKGFTAGLWHPLEMLMGVPLLMYLLILSGASRQIGAGFPNRLFPFAPLSFLTLHLSYGLGSWRGLLDLLRKEVWRKRRQKPPYLS